MCRTRPAPSAKASQAASSELATLTLQLWRWPRYSPGSATAAVGFAAKQGSPTEGAIRGGLADGTRQNKTERAIAEAGAAFQNALQA